jgi:hypothetical protein
MNSRDPNFEGWIAQARAMPIEAGLLGHAVRWKNGGRGVERCGPCPVSGGDDRFAINTAKGLWICRVCKRGGRDAISLAKHIEGLDFVEAVKRLVGGVTSSRPQRSEPRPSTSDAELDRAAIAKARWLWSRRQPLVGSVAHRYLVEARRLRGPFPAGTMAFLPAWHQHPPSLMCAYGMATEPAYHAVGKSAEPELEIAPDAVMAVHLTRLLPDGSGKQPGDDNKITVGRPKGAPIVLAPPNDLLGMLITEGIEDGLSLQQATGLGVWAAGSATYMPYLAEVVPRFIEAVTAVGDRDNGWRYARELTARLRARGDLDVTLRDVTLNSLKRV